MDVKQTFDGAAASYDALRRQLIPCFDPFYGAAVERLALPADRPARVLDVGAGTGLMAELTLRRWPGARLTLLDFSEEMLSRARQRFARLGAPVEVRLGDSTTTPLGGPWDAVVSALSIHHLPPEAKRALYGRIFQALAPGGAFVNADNVLAPEPAEHARQFAAWVAAIRATGLGEPELAAALERTKVDILSPLEDQLGWLRAAGFVDVRCDYQWNHFAVFGGRRPG